MPQPKIKLYVDIISPFGYIGFHLLQNSPVFKQCEITYTPILLGGLMKACGNTPPLNIKNKSTWITTERLRWSTYFSIPMSNSAPPNFPINTLPIQRVLCALQIVHPDSLPAALARFWQDFWVDWKDPLKPGNLLSIVAEVLGSEEEARRVVESTKSEECKKRLSANTEEAFAEGAFGLPYFVATNAKGETERFWGVDHVGQLCDFMDLERAGGRGWRALL
ncbi:thioredoxin-like protein [Ophiobolus disseminans]|uniref:Glutathione S-transferase kappa n=1 Tax=Ophiobolus disseminans TaxID=1469910 RepID=A0A6A7AGS4_9PLEO|nr:thioredoxin-like protein [Ophiobolus disseminans]